MFCHNFCEGGKNNAKTGLVLWFSPARGTGLNILHPFGAILGQCQKERNNMMWMFYNMFCHNFCEGGKNNAKTVGCYGLAPHVVRGYWYYTPSGLFFDNAKKKGILNPPRSASHPSKGAELTTTSRNFKGIVIQKSFWKLDFISLDCHDPAIRNERSELRFLARCS